jgi:hypothetical protein
MPASIDPATVPHRAAETVKPFSQGERLYAAVSPLVVPEMTTVSNPNSSPPRAATRVLFARYAFNFNVPPPSAERKSLSPPSTPGSQRNQENGLLGELGDLCGEMLSSSSP